MNLKDTIYDIVCLEPGVSNAGIYERLVARYKATSRIVRWFGPDSFIADVFAPGVFETLTTLTALENDRQVVRVTGDRTSRGGQIHHYYPMGSRKLAEVRK